jgi:hypothetical protein
MTTLISSARPHHVRRRVGGTLVAAMAGLTTLALAPSALAAGSACPASGGGNIAFSANLTNGNERIGPLATSKNNSATACGLVTPAADGRLRGSIQPMNITFAPSTTTVLILNLPTTLEATGTISGPVAFNADGSVSVSLGGPITATANVLGFKCTIGPFSPTLTTGASGRLQGTPLTADATGAFSGKLVANDFSVPAIRPSLRCPLLIAGATNAVLGLPRHAGQSSVTFDASITLG